MPELDTALDELRELVMVRKMTSSGEARRIRESAGVSLGDVAHVCGTDMATVWKWETGERQPRKAKALRYAEVLKMLKELTD